MGRLVESADFERVLRSASCARTAHFAVHHLPRHFEPGTEPVCGRSPSELSTSVAPVGGRPVDDIPPSGPRQLGAVVPKRHARRAVTRSLLKRQIYAAAGRHAPTLAEGLWIVRLRAPFERERFRSAASQALRLVARAELESLFAAASRPCAT
jgi:ribonuclease P protein component